jgi:antitoxin component HigA of HigAB toxin-antitoxin module
MHENDRDREISKRRVATGHAPRDFRCAPFVVTINRDGRVEGERVFSFPSRNTPARLRWYNPDAGNPEQRDYLDVLTEFVDEYDQGRKIRWPKISGLESLKYLLEENGMSAADLSRILGTSRNLGAMILRGERQLTLAHVRTLAKRFRVSADLFLP